MRFLLGTILVFLLNNVFSQSWEQPVWITDSPQYVGEYEGTGYKFEIEKEKKQQHLVFYKENERWKCKYLDNVGRTYAKAMPDDIDDLVYFFQDIKGGVNLVTVSGIEIEIYRLMSSGFSLYKKACISGNGFTAFFHDTESEMIYFATREGGSTNAFSSMVIFNVTWKRMEEAGKSMWHCFYEQTKGVKKTTLINDEIVKISRAPRGISLSTGSDQRFIIGNLKFGKEAMGQRDSFKCEEAK